MANPSESTRQVFGFLPGGYIDHVEDRVNVRETSKEQIQTIMKTASIFKQEVILHDLLQAGLMLQTKNERDMVTLAAELYCQAPEDTQEDFQLHLLGAAPIVLKVFWDALFANSIFHSQLESIEKGRSGLTAFQLANERKFVVAFEPFANRQQKIRRIG